MFAKTTNSLFLDLHDLQRAGVLVDTRLIIDDGELSIHWSMHHANLTGQLFDVFEQLQIFFKIESNHLSNSLNNLRSDEEFVSRQKMQKMMI